MNPGAVEFYVYYKVAPANVEQVHAIVRRWPDVRLMRRVGEFGDLQTWMEIHSGPDAQHSALALGDLLAPYVAGSRQVERFAPLEAPGALTAP